MGKTDPHRETSAIGLHGHCGALREVARQVKEFRKSPARVLVIGDAGTGKKAVVSALLKETPETQCAEINGPMCFKDPEGFIRTYHGDSAPYPHFPALRGARPDPGKGIADRTVFIRRFDRLNPVNQTILANCFDADCASPAKLKVIATARSKFYEAFQAGELSPEKFLGFEYRIFLPPLSRRFEDFDVLIPALAEAVQQRHEKPGRKLAPTAISAFTKYTWPGNGLELEIVLADLLFKGLPSEIDWKEVDCMLWERREKGLGDMYREIESRDGRE